MAGNSPARPERTIYTYTAIAGELKGSRMPHHSNENSLGVGIVGAPGLFSLMKSLLPVVKSGLLFEEDRYDEAILH